MHIQYSFELCPSHTRYI